jgi:large subunit ribosomal protein L20
VQINRKVLSDLAMQEPYSFKALVDQVKFMRGM